MIASSKLLGVGRDDDRWSAPFKKGVATPLFGGMVVTQVPTDLTGKTIQPSGVSGNQGIINSDSPFPLGLVFESTNQRLQAFANGDTAAGNFDSSAYAKGGDYSVFHRPGNLVDVTDDQRDPSQVARVLNAGAGTSTQNASAPFIVADNWTIGAPVYFTEEGLLTVVAPNTGASSYVRVGFVRATAGSGIDLIVALELNMQQFANA